MKLLPSGPRAARWFDPALATVLFLGCELEVVHDLAHDHGHQHWSLAANMLVVVGLTVPVGWRRRTPLLSASFVVACVLVLLTVTAADVHNGEPATQFVLFIPPYSVAAYCPRRPALLWLVAFLAALGGTVPITGGGPSSLVFLFAAGTGSWVVGRMLRSRRHLAAELTRTSEQIAAERDARAQLAVADQRSRIATELQALVAAGVSEMILHTQSAQWMLQEHPAEADAAMANVEETGRHALTEMRRILGVLRHPDQDVDLAPQPGVGQIPALIERARQSRHAVALTVAGEPGPVPASVDLSLYRIAEEALAGVLRDDANPVDVTLTYHAADVELCITARVPDEPAWPTSAMRERVTLCEGGIVVDALTGDRRRLLVTLPRVFDGALT